MDSYDEDEPEPSPHFWDTAPTHPDQFFEPSPDRLKKFESVLRNPDICLYPPPFTVMIQVEPATDYSYSGPSLLRFLKVQVKCIQIYPDRHVTSVYHLLKHVTTNLSLLQ